MKENGTFIFDAMRWKNLVSLTLIFLFIGKLFIIDANAVEVIFQGDISFVKPHCSKKQKIKGPKGQFQFHQHIDSDDSSIEISSFCTSQFNFDVDSWKPLTSDEFHSKEKLYTSNLSYRYLDSQSPPPKQV